MTGITDITEGITGINRRTGGEEGLDLLGWRHFDGVSLREWVGCQVGDVGDVGALLPLHEAGGCSL